MTACYRKVIFVWFNTNWDNRVRLIGNTTHGTGRSRRYQAGQTNARWSQPVRNLKPIGGKKTPLKSLRESDCIWHSASCVYHQQRIIEQVEIKPRFHLKFEQQYSSEKETTRDPMLTEVIEFDWLATPLGTQADRGDNKLVRPTSLVKPPCAELGAHTAAGIP